MSEAIETGDVVVLKSGGPKMTVKNTWPDTNSPTGRSIACSWITVAGDLCSDVFYEPMLSKEEQSEVT